MAGIERVVEVCASTRVLRERRLRALAGAKERALLGREFVTFRGLAERCAAESDVPVRALLDVPGQTALVAACARGNGALGAQLAERPGFATALADTLRDLRDAGVLPHQLPESHANLAQVHTELERAYDRLAAQGLFDRIGLFRLAQRGVRAWVARCGLARAEVHGATELVGSAGDLIAALGDALGGALRFFQPDTASDYAEKLRAEWPWSFALEPVEVASDPALAPGGELPPGALWVRRARSPREELEGVARELLALIAAGVPPHEIQVVARSLEPYAPWLERTFAGYAIRFTSSLALAEVAEPARRGWLDLARALARDLPRASLLRLLTAPELRVPREYALELSALAERCAREAAVVRGEADWRAALAQADAPAPVRGALERIVARVARAAAELARAPSFASAAEVVAGLGEELFGADSARWARGPLTSVAQLDAVRAAAGAAGAASRGELGAALETALLAPRARPFDDDLGGVRVLDALQARALPCRHLFLIGAVHGAWPRPLAEDPFLSDAVREDLRARLRRPVPVRSRAPQEERFLLGLLLSQARERVVISFPESDSMGRALTPSSLLRALPFVARDTDVLADLPEAGDEAPELLRPAEALVAAAAANDPAAAAIAAKLPNDGAESFAAGRTLVARTDAIEDTALPYDGEVGDALARPAALAPSALEELGGCPLRALFRRLLKARPLDARSADELSPDEAGSLVHHALDAIYSELFASGALAAGGSLAAALERGRALIPAALERAAAEQRARVRERHPTAWSAYRRTVGAALQDFLARDLAELLPGGVLSLETEQPIQARLDAGAERIAIEGKIDRIARLRDAIRVGDYKTGTRFGKPLERRRILRGQALQIPLYARAVAGREPGARVIGEALTVPLRPERDRDGERGIERSRELGELAALSASALAELASLLRRGVFPIAANREECRWCDYTVACRIEHPPSRARIENAEAVRGYFALRERK